MQWSRPKFMTQAVIVIDLMECLAVTCRYQQSLQNRPFKQTNTKDQHGDFGLINEYCAVLIDQTKIWPNYAVDVEDHAEATTVMVFYLNF